MFAIGLTGFGITSVLCGLAPTLELLVVARLLQGAAGALLVPGSLAIITATVRRRGRPRPGDRHLGGGGRGDRPDRARPRRPARRRRQLAGGVPDQRAARRRSPWSRSATCPRAGPGDATARFDWLGAAVAIVAVGGLAFGAIRGQDRNWQDPVAWASLAVGAVALVAFPILMARRPQPARPAGPVPAPAVRDDQPLDAADLRRRCTRWRYLQGLFLQNVVGYTATAAGLIGLPTGIVLDAALGAHRGTQRADRVPAVPRRRPGADGCGPAVAGADPGRPASPWRLAPGDPSTYLPPASTLVDVLPYVLLFGFGFVARRGAADGDADVVRPGRRTRRSRRRSTTRSAASGSRCCRP